MTFNAPIRAAKAAGITLIRALHLYSVGKPWYSGLGSILMFHRVCRKAERSKLLGNQCQEITPEYLENLIEYFKYKRYALVSLDEVYEILSSRRAVADKWIALTFDDGYKDNLHLAYPILKAHSVPFAIYLTTCFPEGTAVLWWYLLDDLISTNSEIRFDWNNCSYAYECAGPEAKEAVFAEVRSLIMKHFQPDDRRVLESVFGPYHINLTKKTAELGLSWPEVIELSRDPLVTIGAHTVNHLRLSELAPDQAEYEVRESRKLIESRIERPVDHFSYPFGEPADAGRREFELAKRCGFKTATTTRLGQVFAQHQAHLTALPRLPVLGLNEDLGKLDLLLSGFIPWVRNRFRPVLVD
jgi:peptidoglycan/xylan/chitin deacetylase (PgdA/CDA1 family)